jgi:Tol biopolymer transport system component
MGVVSSTGQLINDKLHSYAAAPAWSPDGRKIAFFGEPGIGQLGIAYGLGEGIWMIDYPSGGNPTQLFTTDHVKPNGQWLAFEFGPEGSTHETIVINAANGQKVANFPGEQPAWSFDSQKLVIKTCEPSCGLWQVNLNGGQFSGLVF